MSIRWLELSIFHSLSQPIVRAALLPAVLPVVFGAGIWLYGCGAPAEPAKGPEPTKVVWERGEGNDAEAPAEGQSAASGEDTQVGPKEIDLDAPPPKATAKAAAPAAKPAPKEPPAEPAKTEAPPPAPITAAVAADAEGSEDAEAEAEAAAAPAAPVPLGKEMRAAVKGDAKEPPAKKPASKKKASVAAAAAPSAAASYTGPNPCKTAHFSVPRVEEACANNGRSGAKSVMKEAIGKALAAGATLKCADCHTDTTQYKLKKDAVAQLKKWLQ